MELEIENKKGFDKKLNKMKKLKENLFSYAKIV